MMELLAPAGGMEQLRVALRFGADAVYGALQCFGLRAAAENFSWEGLKEALELTHRCGRRFYLTLNILPYDDELQSLLDCARRARDLGVDAAIVSDLGAALLLREDMPELPLHISTQANVMNTPTANFFARLGAERIILSRELSLARIAAIRQALPPSVLLEAFAHGAMCMAYSGRCMLSDHLAGRGGNRGACAQPCRWQYTVVEEKRPGEEMPVIEDGRGTAIFSAYDLNMLSFLPQMRQAGIGSVKIEGRMKSAYYVATVTRAYRRALDLLAVDEDSYRAAVPELQRELATVSHRRSNTGFYLGAPQPAAGAEGFYQTREFAGIVLEKRSDGLLVEVKNRFAPGDWLEALTPGAVRRFVVERIVRIEDGASLPFVSVAGQRVLLSGVQSGEAGDYLRGENRNHRCFGQE